MIKNQKLLKALQKFYLFTTCIALAVAFSGWMHHV